MAASPRIFRLFVSSTFEDLKTEREALHRGVRDADGRQLLEGVFPRLRRLCREHGARFQPVDLRWGITQQASLDQQTMPICLAELARCQEVSPRVNLLILLGDRYGWRPLPAAIGQDEFSYLSERIDAHEGRLLRQWYCQDRNFSAQPRWLLKPREEEFADSVCWSAAEVQLRSALVRASAELAAKSRQKYLASATELEIEAGVFAAGDTEEIPAHKIAFFREIDPLPAGPAAQEFIDVDARGKRDAEAFQRLTQLKDRLRERLAGRTCTYSVAWNEPPDQATVKTPFGTDYLLQLCEDVYGTLAEAILRELESIEDSHALITEVAAHRAFGQERCRHFVGREEQLSAVANYLATAGDEPVIVLGEPGSGKSAFMARVASRAAKGSNVLRFVGATAASSNGRELLQGICDEIGRTQALADFPDQPDWASLVQEFRRRLMQAEQHSPLVLLIDAVDQFTEDDPARSLRWLPVNLPRAVHLIVSASRSELLDQWRGPNRMGQIVELTPLTLRQGEQVLDHWFNAAERTLQPDQRNAVLAGFDRCPQPLWLRLAWQQARRWASFDAPEPLANDVDGLLERTFARWSDVARHGPRLVGHSLGYLASARQGLSEDELVDLLSADEDVMSEFRRLSPNSPPVDRLPDVVWSRLLADFAPYLAEREEHDLRLLSFYHRQLEQAARRTFLDAEVTTARHKALADYFAPQQLASTAAGQWNPNRRKLAELPYQLTQAGEWLRLRQTLLDFDFLSAQVRASGPRAAIEDFAHVSFFEAGHVADSLRAVQRALELSAHVLSRDPLQLASQLTGRLLESEQEEVQAIVRRSRAHAPAAWLRPMRLSLVTGEGALIRTLTGHNHHVSALAVTAQGRIVSGAGQGELKVWDLENGIELHSISLEEATEVTCLAASQSGRQVFSGDSRGRVLAWDAEAGVQLAELDAFSSPVTELQVQPDGLLLVGGCQQNTLRVWDLPAGDLRHELPGGAPLAILPDNRLAAGSADKELTIWDLDAGEALQVMPLPNEVVAINLTSDGNRMVAMSAGFHTGQEGSDDHRGLQILTMFDLDTGQPVWQQYADEGRLTGMLQPGRRRFALSPDGTRAVTPSLDHVLRVWWLGHDKPPIQHSGHAMQPTCVAFAPNGQVVSGGLDRTVRVWNLDRWTPLDDRPAHPGEVNSVAVTPDGLWGVSGAIDNRILVWNMATGRLHRQMAGDPAFAEMVWSVALTPDGNRALSGLHNGTIELWDVSSAASVQHLEGHSSIIILLRPAADGKTLISIGMDLETRVWNLDQGQQIACYDNKYDFLEGIAAFFGVAITPDASRMLAGSMLGEVVVWDPRQGSEIARFRWDGGPGPDRRTTAAAISDDGNRIVTGFADGTVLLSNAPRLSEPEVLGNHDDAIMRIAITPDGRHAVSASRAQTATLWNLDRRKAIATFTGESSMLSCAISANARTLLAGEHGGRVHLLRSESASHGHGPASQTTSGSALTPDAETGSSGKPAEVDAEALREEAVRQNLLAAQLERNGDLENAISAAYRALSICQQLAELDPQDIQRQHDLAVNQQRIGAILLARARSQPSEATMEAALEAHKSSLIYTARCLEQEPNHLRWRFDHAYGHEGMGDAHHLRGDLQGALREYMRSRELLHAVVSEAPDYADATWNLGGIGNRIANVMRELDRLEEALCARRMAAAVFESLLASTPDAPRYARDLAVTYFGIASLLGGLQQFLLASRYGLLARDLLRGLSETGSPLAATDRDQLAGIEELTADFPSDANLPADGLHDPDQTRCVLTGHQQQVFAVACLPDGSCISGSLDGTLRRWDIEGGLSIAQIEANPEGVTALAVCSSGQRVVTGGVDGTVALLHLDSPDSTTVRGGHDQLVASIAVSPDEKLAWSGGLDGQVLAWDLERGELKGVVCQGEAVTCVVVSADGQRLYVARHSGLMEIWNRDQGEQVGSLEGHAAAVLCMAFLPGGHRALTGSFDQTLRLWDLDRQLALRTLAPRGDAVRGIAIHPDRRRVIIACHDATVRIWDAVWWAQIATLTGHQGPVRGIALSAEGKWAVSCSDDQTVAKWKLLLPVPDLDRREEMTADVQPPPDS